MEILEGLRSQIEGMRGDLADAVAAGGAATMEEYIRMTARIRAFEDVLVMTTEIEKRYLDS